MRRLRVIAALMLAAFAPQTPTDIKPPRLEAAETRRVTASLGDYIATQLINNGCWTDHRDMSDARRLLAVFRVHIGADGHFTQEPELIRPAPPPSGDAPLQTFIGYAREALAKCNAIGFKIPPDAADLVRDQAIDIYFSPRVG